MKCGIPLRVLALALAVAGVGAGVAGAQDSRPSALWAFMLKRYDKDGDGKISRFEYGGLAARFKALDADGDGFLTAKDFEESAAPAAPAAPIAGAEVPTPVEPAPAATAEDIKFFESKIRPILVTSCTQCHGERGKPKADLRLDTRVNMLKGGAGGPAIIPGDVENSSLIQALRYQPDTIQMPPKGRLPDAVIADFETWVRRGAAFPDTKVAPRAARPVPPDATGAAAAAAAYPPIDIAKGKEFWAFKAPQKSEPPAVKNQTWATTPVDRFLMAAMEEKNLTPVRDADRRTWLRRVTFDLTGLPPTPEELAAFDGDKAADAFEKVVDRLLASPRFGETWGRNWLDVARYAESSGKDSNIVYPHAWRYRDWVVDAVNEDKRYDVFLQEQLAGDLMPPYDERDKARKQIATGFLAIGTKGHQTRNRRQFDADLIDEQIDTTTQAMLGVTVACARCHDHKFDPIPQRDYYALAGIFASTETCYGTISAPGNNHPAPMIALTEASGQPKGAVMPDNERRLLEMTRDRLKSVAGGDGVPPGRPRPGMPGKPGADGARPGADGSKPGQPTTGKPMPGQPNPGMPGETAKPGAPAAPGAGAKKPDAIDFVRQRFAGQQVTLIDQLLSRFDAYGQPNAENMLAMGVREQKRPHDVRVLQRGEVDKPGDNVARGFVQVLSTVDTLPIKKGSGRAELAQWIGSPSNPLTARVWVNRVWSHLFGRGIVATPDNFGASGVAPSNQALLDNLAVGFVDNNWSTKILIRTLVLTHAYRMSSDQNAANSSIDPEDVYVWRVPKRRLPAEAIRDAMLSVAGTLDTRPPVASPINTIEGAMRNDEIAKYLTIEKPVRSVWLPVMRDHVPHSLEVFDFAEPSFVVGEREVTNVASQALYLMNDPEVQRQADAFAARVLAKSGSDETKMAYAFELAYGRKPSSAELSAVYRYFEEFKPSSPKNDKPDAKRPPARPAGKGAAGNRSVPYPAQDGNQPSFGPHDPHHQMWSGFCQALIEGATFRYID